MSLFIVDIESLSLLCLQFVLQLYAKFINK